MSDSVQQPAIHDPNVVREVVCDGPMNVQWGGNRATITLTHLRAQPEPLLRNGELHLDLVVAARIATSVQNLIGLRDLLIRLFPPDRAASEPKASEGGGGGTLH
jgi:hypothetical protein